MFKNVWLWILAKVFRISTETKQNEVEDNTRYAFEYERIDNINFASIFSNKLANYVISDSNLNITGENARVDLLNQTGQSLWKKAKKITGMAFGYGGVFLVPYVKGKKLFYNKVSQGRVTIDKTEGDLITGATILAERKEITRALGQTKTYIRWTNYRLENGNCVIEQKFSDETGAEIPVPEFWKNIKLKEVISNVDRALLGYIKSPINNRRTNDKYGVPITYGCDATIKEIKETMKQIYDEFTLKRPFVGVDATLFNGKNALPRDGLYKAFDFGDNGEEKFEVFDPAFRSYTERLEELYSRLEHEVGTSRGILTEPLSTYQNTDETRRAMQDTYSLIDSMRQNIEKGINDFLYSCNVLANAYNLSPQGEYECSFDWSYYFVESSAETWQQLLVGFNKGVVSKEELRAFLYPTEDEKIAKKILNQIKEESPNVDDLLGIKDEE